MVLWRARAGGGPTPSTCAPPCATTGGAEAALGSDGEKLCGHRLERAACGHDPGTARPPALSDGSGRLLEALNATASAAGHEMLQSTASWLRERTGDSGTAERCTAQHTAAVA